MDILFIRHSEAEDGPSDEARALTEKGKSLFTQSVKTNISRIPKLDLMLTSPLTRALQTAAILTTHAGVPEAGELEELKSETSPDETLKAVVRESAGKQAVCCVGHEPNLSSLISLCLTKNMRQIVKMKPGSMCLVSFEGAPLPGRGLLKWLCPM